MLQGTNISINLLLRCMNKHFNTFKTSCLFRICFLETDLVCKEKIRLLAKLMIILYRNNYHKSLTLNYAHLNLNCFKQKQELIYLITTELYISAE